MPDLDATLNQQLDAVCASVCKRHHLGPEVHAALFARMRDQLETYLHGNVPLSADEALLLVQESFADAATVADLAAAPVLAGRVVPAPRRILMAFAALCSVDATVKAVTTVVSIALVMALRPTDDSGSSLYDSLSFLVQLLVSALGAVLLWTVFVRWQRRIAANEPGGLAECSTVTLAGGAGAALAAFVLIPHVPLTMGHLGVTRPYAFTHLLTLYYFVHGVVLCLAWVWWCDRPPHRSENLALGFGAWAAWSLLMSLLLLGGLVQLDVTYHEGTIPYGASVTLAQVDVPGLTLPWRLSLEFLLSGLGLRRLVSVVPHLAGTLVITGGLYFAIFGSSRKR